MEANHFSESKFDVIHNDWPQICQNTSTGSLSSQSNQNQKTNNCEKSELCLNQVKTQRLNSCISHKIKQKKSEDSHSIQQFNSDLRKQTLLNSYNVQHFTEKLQNNFSENRKKINSLFQQNQADCSQLYADGLNQQKNLNYKTNKEQNNLNFYYIQKINQKNQKIFIPHRAKISPQKLTSMLKNQGLSIFLKGPQILYPIPDHIIKATLPRPSSPDFKSELKPRDLPIGFCFLLEMMNLSYIFPEMFKLQEETIFKIAHILQAPLQCKDHESKFTLESIETQLNEVMEDSFSVYMKQLSGLIIEELSSQKLQSLTDQHTYNVLCLSKFSQQNQLLDFVFQYNWPLILLEMSKLSLEESKDDCEKYAKSLRFMKNSILSQQHEMPKNFQLRFEIISLLIDSYSKTTSFRQLFNKKLQQSRNVNKRKINLEEQKKNIQQMIKKVHSSKLKKTKKITKKKNLGYTPEPSDDDESKNINGHKSQVDKLKQQLCSLNGEIQKQNRYESLSACHYLGKDSNDNLYWYVTFFPDKLFLQSQNKWSYLTIQHIHHFMGCLERKGIQENRLFERLQEYFLVSVNKFLSKMDIQTQENNPLFKSGSLFHSSSTMLEKQVNHFVEIAEDDAMRQNQEENDSSKNSFENGELLTGLGVFRVDKDSLFRMIEVGEKKMTEYLKQRNSRWGSEENKQQLFSTIKSDHANWLQESKRQISQFNQKICVVEIQYKVFVQQSAQQVDSKVKKIQTKIWGINEKYKHNWYDFISSCKNFTELFFAVSVLYSLIKKYTSKQRKLRKQYEQIKQKSVWKTTAAIKQWKQSWNQQCQVCGSNGQVLCCDYCPKVYHLGCVDLKEVPLSEFKCKSCKQQITTRNQFKSLANSRKKDKR